MQSPKRTRDDAGTAGSVCKRGHRNNLPVRTRRINAVFNDPGKISHALHCTLKDLFDFEYPESKGDAFENEIDKLIAFLKTRDSDDIKMCYQMLKIFWANRKNYHHTGKPANIA